jgi:hypothetical protein
VRVTRPGTLTFAVDKTEGPADHQIGETTRRNGKVRRRSKNQDSKRTRRKRTRKERGVLCVLISLQEVVRF